MKYGVLGTGMVGQAVASKLAELGHDVTMGSRAAGNPKGTAWAERSGESARAGSFADAAVGAEIVINATSGAASLDALHAAGAENLAGKVVIDIANPLDGSSGFPPALSVCNTDSLGEQIQRAFPEARVVKTLNTINADVMVMPSLVPGKHTIFMSGNDAGAKRDTLALLQEFGWSPEQVIDLGDISTSRGTEMYLALWLRLLGPVGTSRFSIAIQRG